MYRPFAAALILLLGSTCQAELISLTIADDLVFADGVLRDANPEGPSTATVEIFTTDGMGGEPSAPISTTAEFDLEVPGFGPLSDDGTSAVSATGGFLTVALPGGESVQLDLAEVSLSYFALPQAILVFAEGTGFNPTPDAGEMQQQTHATSEDSEPVSLTFIGNVRASNVSNTSGGNGPPQGTVTEFTAESRGDVEDAELLPALVPEPSTAALIFLVALAGLRRRPLRG